MKVFFLFHGATHYFNLITNQINKSPGIDIFYIYPKIHSNAMGDGVFQTLDGVEFKLVEMEEKTDPVNGYSYFAGLDQLIIEHKPAILLVTEIHLKSLYLDKELRKLLKELGIKVILKSIPFQIGKYKDEIRNFKLRAMDAPLPTFSSLPGPASKFLRALKFDRLYKIILGRKARKKFVEDLKLRKALFNFPDAHVNYIEEAYDIFGSYGVAADKIFITYNSPDTDLWFAVKNRIKGADAILPPNKFRLVHLSRLVGWKRVDMLINAVSNLIKAYPGIELLVVGEGPEKESLINQSRTLGVDRAVKFLGGVYEPDLLGKYLMASSVYVLAGMGGLSINDAMCFGLPVICSVCDGTEKYLVKEGYNGLYFEAGDQNSLESKIKYLFDNPELCSKMGKNSVSIIQNEINIHTVVNGYLKAFNHVTQKSA